MGQKRELYLSLSISSKKGVTKQNTIFLIKTLKNLLFKLKKKLKMKKKNTVT